MNGKKKENQKYHVSFHLVFCKGSVTFELKKEIIIVHVIIFMGTRNLSN